AVDVAVGELRPRPRLGGATDVLVDPDVAGGVILDSLVAAATDRAGDVGDDRRVARGRRVGGSARVLGGQQQALRPRIPGRAVDRRQRIAFAVVVGEQGDPVGAVG